MESGGCWRDIGEKNLGQKKLKTGTQILGGTWKWWYYNLLITLGVIDSKRAAVSIPSSWLKSLLSSYLDCKDCTLQSRPKCLGHPRPLTLTKNSHFPIPPLNVDWNAEEGGATMRLNIESSSMKSLFFNLLLDQCGCHFAVMLLKVCLHLHVLFLKITQVSF